MKIYIFYGEDFTRSNRYCTYMYMLMKIYIFHGEYFTRLKRYCTYMYLNESW